MTALGISRNEGESWLDCALRYGRKFGLENEVQEQYDRYRALGDTEEEAAWGAVYEWDCCDLVRNKD